MQKRTIQYHIHCKSAYTDRFAGMRIVPEGNALGVPRQESELARNDPFGENGFSRHRARWLRMTVFSDLTIPHRIVQK